MPHPDEGTIHAWLDGALGPAEARAIEAHVAECPACASAVADARGVLAAASRILSALDSVPGGVLPSPAESTEGHARANRDVARERRPFRAARWRLAAALMLVAGGSWVVARTRTSGTPVQTTAASSAVPAAEAKQPPSAILDSVPPVQQERALDMAQTRERVAEAAAQPRRSALPDANQGRQVAVAGAVGSRAGRPGTIAENAAVTQQASGAPQDARHEADAFGAPAARSDLRASVAAAPVAGTGSTSDRSTGSGAMSDTTGSRRAERLAKASASAQGERRQQSTTIVIDRAYVDSVLAADSSFEPPRALPLGAIAGRGGSAQAKTRAGAPASPPQAALERSRPAAAFTDRAAGCYTMDTTAWLPRARGETEAVSLVPARIELRRDRGLSGDEWGNLLVRPAPGEPPLPAGAVAFWKPLGNDKVRVTIADNTSWVSLTLVVGENTIEGPGRAYSPDDDRLRTSQISGRRVLCRTEP